MMGRKRSFADCKGMAVMLVRRGRKLIVRCDLGVLHQGKHHAIIHKESGAAVYWERGRDEWESG